ncbi:transcriptional regulator [Thiohalorhabdus methylotrophus]|uniref:Transcriptional regulator n=1 Tax=Thiohalorhabdus methylotrophus TaxID=3242694 RepID=A0ABV4TTK6_9GAMM
MYRKDLILMLRDNPMGVGELAQALGMRGKDVADELTHLRQSLRNEPYRLEVIPAVCRKCGFTFSADKLTKPGKCPECRGTWIHEPRVWIVAA